MLLEDLMPTSLLCIRKKTLLALTAAAIVAGPGHAFSAEPVDAGQRARIIQNGGTLDLQALDRKQRGREFQQQQQQQQQQLREQGRQLNQPQGLDIPVMRPSTNPSAVPIFR
jgi:hypothetical protein